MPRQSLQEQLAAANEKGADKPAKKQPAKKDPAPKAEANGHVAAAPTLAVLPISKVVPATDNPRSTLGDLDGLVESIKAVGIIEPLVVEEWANGAYQVIAGHRRLEAAKKAGLKELPAMVRPPTKDADRLELMLIENLQRDDLSPLDEARGFARLVDLGLKQTDIAARVGCSQSHVSKRVALVELPVVAQELLGKDSGGISLEDAGELLKLKDEAKRLERVLKEVAKPNQYYGVEHFVRGELAGIKSEGEADVAVAAATKKGWSVFDRRGGGKKKGDYTEIVRQDWSPGLHLDAKDHEAEPCHGVEIKIRPYGGIDQVSVCTDAKRHTPSGESKLKGTNKKPATPAPASRPGSARESDADKARREKEAAEKTAREERRMAHLTSILSKKIAVARALPLLLDSIVGDFEAYLDDELACEMLGLEAKDGAAKTFAAFARSSEDAKLRAAVAGTLSGPEDSLRDGYAQWLSTEIRLFYGFLVDTGYALDAFETKELGGKNWREAKS